MKENFEVNRKGSEVNRRGPEFAGAFEWVKGKHGYSALRWARLAPFFAAIGAAMIMYTAGEEMANRDEVVVPTASPRPPIGQVVPSSKPTATTRPTVSPTASPSPSPTASPTPSPSPSPTTTPAPPPNLPAAPQQTDPKVTPTPEPETSPTPEPETSPTPEPETSPTPTPTTEEPSFTDTSTYTTGGDIVCVKFTIQVDSVDGQDGEAVLMRKDGSSGEYQQIEGSGASMAYTGDWTGSWTVPNDSESDVLYAKLPFAEGHQGSIEHLQVRFNYTNSNGESDYVDSTEIAVCRGTYVSFDSSMLGGSGFSVDFLIDTDILDDPSKVTCTSATVEINGTERELSASISDGVLTVGGLFEEILDSDETIESMGPVKVTLNYNDGDVDWTVEAEGEVDRSPDIFFGNIYIGSKLNGPGGLRSAMIEYSIIDNGALVSGSSVTLRQGEHEKTWNNEESGDFTINDSIVLEDDDGYLYYPSTGMEAELTIWYSLDDGETWLEKSETSTDVTICDCYLDVTINEAYSEGGDGLQVSGTVTLVPVSENDPCEYSAYVTGASIEWLPEDPEETPHSVDFYYNDETTEGEPLTTGESREFTVWSSPPEPSTAPTGFRLHLEASDASGVMGGVTYGYVGVLGGSAEGRLPDPTETSVTVSSGKGTISGGQLSASGTATVTFDASKDIADGVLDSIYVNWFDSYGNEWSYDDITDNASLSLTGSSGTQLSFAYSFSGVDVPENVTQFTVQIGFDLYDSGGEFSEWTAGESDKAALSMESPFGKNGSFTTGEDLIGFIGSIDFDDTNYSVESMQNVELHFISEGTEVGTLSVEPYPNGEGLAGFSFSVEEDFPGRYANQIYITGSYNGIPCEASPRYSVAVSS